MVDEDFFFLLAHGAVNGCAIVNVKTDKYTLVSTDYHDKIPIVSGSGKIQNRARIGKPRCGTPREAIQMAAEEPVMSLIRFGHFAE